MACADSSRLLAGERSVVLNGAFEWRLEDGRVVTGGESNVVCLPTGTVYSIVCISQGPGIEFACGGRHTEETYV